MSLSITGKVIKVLPVIERKGNKYQILAIKTQQGQKDKEVYFEFWGTKVDTLSQLKSGQEIEVHFNLESREYNDKIYHNVQAWKWEAK